MAESSWHAAAPKAARSSASATNSRCVLTTTARLDRAAIIKNRSEFSDIINKGLLFQGRYFSLFYRDETRRRIGFSAKRGLKAVERNRLRRRERELWRSAQEHITVNGAFILIGREQALHAPFALLERDLLALLAQISKRMQPNRNHEEEHPSPPPTRKPFPL